MQAGVEACFPPGVIDRQTDGVDPAKGHESPRCTVPQAGQKVTMIIALSRKMRVGSEVARSASSHDCKSDRRIQIHHEKRVIVICHRFREHDHRCRTKRYIEIKGQRQAEHQSEADCHRNNEKSK